jgi:plastocyanin
MKRLTFSRTVFRILVAAASLASAAEAGKTYIARVGAETPDESVQADAFFPNELWILQNDSIQFQFVPKNEIHTLTFLKPGQVRPPAPPPAGPPLGATCPAAAAPVTYDGSACVSTQTGLTAPSTFTVTFPTAGNYKMVCLVHTDMNGAVHVLANNSANAALLQTQNFYDQQGAQEANAILLDNTLLQFLPPPIPSSQNSVTAGIGKIVATGGGLQYGAVVRFLSGKITIHKGQSVTWTNLDPTEPHTVTFGTEPAGFIPPVPVGLSGTAADGTLSASLASTTGFLNSGFLQAQAPDQTGSPQLPVGTTRITITFNQTGNYYYHCALHDVDGMNGEVVVVP